jgi:hypothetical protein
MTTASSGEPGPNKGPADDPSGSQSPPPRIVRPVPPAEIRAYSQWLNDCVRAELRRVRLERGVTPYALAVPGLLNKQTTANIENGVNSSTLVTLAFVSVRLGTRAEDVVIEGTSRQPCPGDGSTYYAIVSSVEGDQAIADVHRDLEPSTGE